MKRITILASVSFLFLIGCKEQKGQTHGPIILGDSSTIVTETDPKYLEDLVPDLQPAADRQPAAPTPEKPAAADTADTKPATATPASDKGFTLAFKEVTLFIPNIETHEYRKQDLSRSNNATYELRGGKLAGNEIQVKSGTVTKVSQRYQTQLALQNGGKKLALTSLGNYLSNWETIGTSGKSFPIKGIDEKQLDFRTVSAAQVRTAVQKAARAQRMSKAETAIWVKLASSYKNSKQNPAVVQLNAVMWRVEGKGFWKEIRMDVP